VDHNTLNSGSLKLEVAAKYLVILVVETGNNLKSAHSIRSVHMIVCAIV